MKQCNKCHISKKLNEFNKDKSTCDGYYRACKPCAKQIPANKKENTSRRAKVYYQQDKQRAKGYNLTRLYGITLEEYNQMLIMQNNCCAICKQQFDNNTRATTPCVDHSHSSGNIRALLCGHCNKAIGLLREDTTIFESAIKYLQLFEEIPHMLQVKGKTLNVNF